MKFLYCHTFLTTLALLLISPVHADDIYKLLPLNTSISSSEVIQVNYDFTEKKGIQCLSSNNNIWVDFNYKGHQHKTARLPVILQSDHVPQRPNKQNEELADVKGYLKLFIKDSKQYIVHAEVICHYLQGGK